MEPHFPKDREDFLSLAERENRDRHCAALVDHTPHGARKPLLLPRARETDRRLRIAARGFHDQNIHPALGKIRTGHDRLVLKIHIARVKERLPLVPDHHARRAQNVTRMVELESHFVVVIRWLAGEVAAFPQTAAHPGLLTEIHPPMCEERILHQIQLLPLPRHHAHGIMQHDFANMRRRLGHKNRRLRLAARQHRQRTDVVLMRMGDDNCVHRAFGNLRKIRHHPESIDLRVRTGIEDDVLASDADPIRVRADSQVAREIDEFHSAGNCALSCFCSIPKFPPRLQEPGNEFPAQLA